MKTTVCTALALVLASATALASAQAQNPEQIPSEGYVDRSGRLILPLRKVLANRRLMVRDMGSAFAACPKTHGTLDQIRDAMFATEAKGLEERGYSPADYAAFWEASFAEGKAKPVSVEACDSELSSWKLMLKNIRER